MSKKILVYEMSDTRFEALKKTLRPLGVSVYKVAKSQMVLPPAMESLLLVRQGKKLWERFEATLIYRELHRFRQSECHVLVRCLYLAGFPVRRWMLY